MYLDIVCFVCHLFCVLFVKIRWAGCQNISWVITVSPHRVWNRRVYFETCSSYAEHSFADCLTVQPWRFDQRRLLRSHCCACMWNYWSNSNRTPRSSLATLRHIPPSICFFNASPFLFFSPPPVPDVWYQASSSLIHSRHAQGKHAIDGYSPRVTPETLMRLQRVARNFAYSDELRRCRPAL